mgnify:CR=1 FL=1
MARIWTEDFDDSRHVNHMPEIDDEIDANASVIIIEVGKFKLEFLSILQLKAAIEYFQSPLGSSRISASGGDHWEFQPWQSRLPKGIINKHNRTKVLKALISARGLVE